MNLLRVPVLFCGLLLAAVPVHAQRVVEPAAEIESFRPLLEQRIWTFSYQNQTLGHLVSLVKERTRVEGQTAVVLQEKLDVDYALTGAEQKIFIEGQHLLTPQGEYLGDRKDITINDQSERFEFTRYGDTVRGFFTRGGNKVARTVVLGGIRRAWDDNFVDQLELLLAMRRLTVGAAVVDSIFQPRSLFTVAVRGEVESFEYKELWKNRFDSVFVIRLSEPQEIVCYFTPDKRLIRTDLLAQGIRVYQDAILPPPKRPPAPAVTRVTPPGTGRLPWWGQAVVVLPHAVAFLLFAAIGLAVTAWPGFRHRMSYVALAAGAGLYLLLLPTFYAVQERLIASVVTPAVIAGEPTAIRLLLPAALESVVQESLKLLTILLFIRLVGHRKTTTILGAFTGAGLALSEAVYRTAGSIVPLFSWHLMNNAAFILFHLACGALLGWGLSGSGRRLAGIWGVVVGANLLLRYLPALANAQGWEMAPVEFIAALVALGVLSASVMVAREGTA